ncbi:MAG: 50S ribosomal protein L15 [Firmicutes bacterium]|jgi:large subunit ribosomal protein L15|nr:50S ribosomal protein L15 [Bacillota bacterium]
MIKLHDLSPSAGANKSKKRVGRGTGGKGGKTAGRGTKGQLARNTVKAGFEGGQLPLTQRLPKLRGFANPFRIEYNVVNLDVLNQLIEKLSAEGKSLEINPEVLKSEGIVHHKGLIKVLGRGEITAKAIVHAHGFSASAKEAILAAGGKVVLVPLPFGDRRPPAKGNALANR